MLSKNHSHRHPRRAGDEIGHRGHVKEGRVPARVGVNHERYKRRIRKPRRHAAFQGKGKTDPDMLLSRETRKPTPICCFPGNE